MAISESDIDTKADEMIAAGNFKCDTPGCGGQPKRHPTKFRQPPTNRSQSGKLYNIRLVICDTCGRPKVAIIGVRTQEEIDAES